MSSASISADFLEVSSSAATFESLDRTDSTTENTISNPLPEHSLVHTLGGGLHTTNEHEKMLRDTLEAEVYGHIPVFHKTDPLPPLNAVVLEHYIISELLDTEHITTSMRDDGTLENVAHLIMCYFHSMQRVLVHLVRMNGVDDSSIISAHLLLYKEDRPYRAMLSSAAVRFGVNPAHLMLFELWQCILTKLKHESVSMFSSSTDQIVAYYMPSLSTIQSTLFHQTQPQSLAFTTLLHQCTVEVAPPEHSEGGNGMLAVPPSGHQRRSISKSKSLTATFHRESTISELSLMPPSPINPHPSSSVDGVHDGVRTSFTFGNTHLTVPEEVNSFGARRRKHAQSQHSGDDLGLDRLINVGIPIPFMLPRNTTISTALIAKQCDMILAPYLKSMRSQRAKSKALYTLYLLTKTPGSLYCAVCRDNAYCRGCPLEKYKEVNTGEMDFIVSVRWADEETFNMFDQMLFGGSR